MTVFTPPRRLCGGHGTGTEIGSPGDGSLWRHSTGAEAEFYPPRRRSLRSRRGG